MPEDGFRSSEAGILLRSFFSEAAGYLGARHWFEDDGSNVASRVSPTGYAGNAGAIVSRAYRTEDGSNAGWWWLRSPGESQDRAAYIVNAGSLRSRIVRYGSVCVRPVLWLNTEAGFR